MNLEFDWVLAPSISIQASEELQDIFFLIQIKKDTQRRL